MHTQYFQHRLLSRCITLTGAVRSSLLWHESQRCVALIDDMQGRGIDRTARVYQAAMHACKEVSRS